MMWTQSLVADWAVLLAVVGVDVAGLLHVQRCGHVRWPWSGSLRRLLVAFVGDVGVGHLHVRRHGHARWSLAGRPTGLRQCWWCGPHVCLSSWVRRWPWSGSSHWPLPVSMWRAMWVFVVVGEFGSRGLGRLAAHTWLPPVLMV